MKRLLLWVVVLVLSMSMVAAFSFAGCKKAAPAEEAVVEAPAEEGVVEAPAEEAVVEAPAKEATLQIFLPWGVEAVEGDNPMANAFRAWRDQVAAEKFPNITVEIITSEWGDHWTWLQTRIASKDAPDLVCQRVDQGHGYLTPTVQQEEAGEAFWVDLGPYLEEVNPYTDTVWKDEYSPSHLGAAKGKLSKIYYVPISQGARAFIYNVAAFEEAGIEKAPSTAKEFLEDLEILKQAGWEYPIGGTGQATDGGFAMDLASGIASSALLSRFQSIAGVDDINPDIKALYTAMANGEISYKDPEIKAIMEFQKKVAEYVDPAAYSRTFDDVYGPFTQGDFAMMSEFNGRFIRVESAIAAGTSQIEEVGTFSYPIADKETFPFSDALVTLPGQISTWGCTWSISSEAEERGTLDAAVDFLQWWASGAENDYCWDRSNPAKANGDAPPTKTAIENWTYKPVAEFLLQDFSPGWGALMLAADGTMLEKVYTYAQAYLQGQMSYDDFATKADTILQEEATLALANM